MTPAQKESAKAFISDEDKVVVYFAGPFKLEPDLILGTVDDKGHFQPNKEEYSDLEPWLREQEQIFIEECDIGYFGLNDLIISKSALKFAYGPDWQDIWGWDDDEGVWFRKG